MTPRDYHLEPEQPGTPAVPDPPAARRRRRAVIRGSRGQLVAAVLLAGLGFAGVVQVRATDRNAGYAGTRQQDLIQLLDSLSAASDRAAAEVAQLERTRNALRSDSNRRAAALREGRQQATTLGILAGTLPAVGPGIRVTVSDPAGTVGVDQLLNGLQELRDAGAEAIEINDRVRVVAQTALQDGNGGIVVGGQRLTPPYFVDAIGAPDTLAQALTFTGGFADGVQEAGGKVAISEAKRVEIAATAKPRPFRYASPVPPG